MNNMSSYINRKQSNVTGVGDWIPLNRWANDDYSVVIVDNGTSTYTVEGTLDQINRKGVIGNEVVFGIENLEAVTGDMSNKITETPMEAVRINVDSGDVDFHVMQNGT